MQTFLPFSVYTKSAQALDYRRLGKQRVEAWQILHALHDLEYGWQNHPAVKMWRGYETSLAQYGRVVCEEWRRRGYQDNMLEDFEDTIKNRIMAGFPDVPPPWLGGAIHRSHRAMLLHKSLFNQKDFDWYSQFDWEWDASVEYYWPETEVRSDLCPIRNKLIAQSPTA